MHPCSRCSFSSFTTQPSGSWLLIAAFRFLPSAFPPRHSEPAQRERNLLLFCVLPSAFCLLSSAAARRAVESIFREAAHNPNRGTSGRFAEFRVITVHLKEGDKSSIFLYLLGTTLSGGW